MSEINLTDLPQEILEYILSFSLSSDDAVALHLTCKTLHDKISSSNVWKRVCMELNPSSSTSQSRHWRREFIGYAGTIAAVKQEKLESAESASNLLQTLSNIKDPMTIEASKRNKQPDPADHQKCMRISSCYNDRHFVLMLEKDDLPAMIKSLTFYSGSIKQSQIETTVVPETHLAVWRDTVICLSIETRSRNILTAFRISPEAIAPAGQFSLRDDQPEIVIDNEEDEFSVSHARGKRILCTDGNPIVTVVDWMPKWTCLCFRAIEDDDCIEFSLVWSCPLADIRDSCLTESHLDITSGEILLVFTDFMVDDDIDVCELKVQIYFYHMI